MASELLPAVERILERWKLVKPVLDDDEMDGPIEEPDGVICARFITALAASLTDVEARAAVRVSRVVGGEWIVQVYCPKRDDQKWANEAPFVAGRLYDADLLLIAKNFALPIIAQLREPK